MKRNGIYAALVQWLRRRTHNPEKFGSIPTCGTYNKSGKVMKRKYRIVTNSEWYEIEYKYKLWPLWFRHKPNLWNYMDSADGKITAPLVEGMTKSQIKQHPKVPHRKLLGQKPPAPQPKN